MEKVTILPYENIYTNFIDKTYIPQGKDENHFRNIQVKRPKEGWRHLRSDEVERLVKNSNTSTNWDDIWVTNEFDTNMIKDNHFFGMVRIGRVQREVLQYHDLRLPVGITGSTIISCDIGDNVAIHDVHYMANYIIENQVILFNIQELSTTDHSKFGNGIIKDGESENVRIWVEVMNEACGRRILPFDGMITADAYLWAKYADDTILQKRLQDITQSSFDSRRGYYGTIGEGCVIKNSWILKDAKIGPHCYIKGASKLKNVTINSSENETSQIGEGVIMVNGVTGYGCHIFYSVVCTRFVLGNRCNLKYGARIINSVLGDNSTISCCEILNNLIFPSHEQHHNNSFLISACVMGQSNLAAGATIGSNHNSRSTDGEIVAGRGFWPGLCTSVKHSSLFASFTLLSKADYPHELNIKLPFSLVNNNVHTNELEIMPAYWWMYNMYAIARNSSKYQKRDRRKHKIQNIEFETLAPDTMNETLTACQLVEEWTAKAFLKSTGKWTGTESIKSLQATGQKLLLENPTAVSSLFVEGEGIENSPRRVHILKPAEAYQAYREMLNYYAAKCIIQYIELNPESSLSDICQLHLHCGSQRWINLGGQLVKEADIDQIRSDINHKILNSWDDIHQRYNQLWKEYPLDKLCHALYVIQQLYQQEITPTLLANLLKHAIDIQNHIKNQVYKTREKDYQNHFRNATFRNNAEKEKVIGTLDSNSFILQINEESEKFFTSVNKILEM